MAFRTERELEEIAVAFLQQMDFLYCWRVPLHNRVIDLVALDGKGQLVGVEFKLRDWKRALEQAVKNSNSLDYAYVCLPGGSYLDELKSRAERLGIGVMVYSEELGTVEIELSAQKRTQQWKPNIEYIKHYVHARGTK